MSKILYTTCGTTALPYAFIEAARRTRLGQSLCFTKLAAMSPLLAPVTKEIIIDGPALLLQTRSFRPQQRFDLVFHVIPPLSPHAGLTAGGGCSKSRIMAMRLSQAPRPVLEAEPQTTKL